VTKRLTGGEEREGRIKGSGGASCIWAKNEEKRPVILPIKGRLGEGGQRQFFGGRRRVRGEKKKVAFREDIWKQTPLHIFRTIGYRKGSG